MLIVGSILCSGYGEVALVFTVEEVIMYSGKSHIELSIFQKLGPALPHVTPISIMHSQLPIVCDQ